MSFKLEPIIKKLAAGVRAAYPDAVIDRHADRCEGLPEFTVDIGVDEGPAHIIVRASKIEVQRYQGATYGPLYIPTYYADFDRRDPQLVAKVAHSLNQPLGG